MEIPHNILYIHMHTYLGLTISVLSELNSTPQCVSHISPIICLQTKKAKTWGTQSTLPVQAGTIPTPSVSALENPTCSKEIL